jgi:HAD superfamily hydrolase (TIGR01509 family)
VSSDPITGANRRAGWLAVHVNCNDLAANGAEPIGVMATLLFPEGTGEEAIEAVTADIDQAARELGIEVLGGHSEVTAGIPRLIVMLTALGRARRGRYVTSGGALPGDDLLLTKGAAIEGTAILSHDYEERLKACLPSEVVAAAQRLYQRISVVPEGMLAASRGVHAMHDVTEGGVIGALYEMAEASGVGLEVWAERIPVRPETRAVCDVFGADPLRLVGSGAMVMATPEGPALAAALTMAGIETAVVGKVTPSGRTLHTAQGEVELEPPARDELWRVIENNTGSQKKEAGSRVLINRRGTEHSRSSYPLANLQTGIRGVIFDLYDTLVYVNEVGPRSTRRAWLGRLGLSEQRFGPCWRAGRDRRMMGLGGSLAQQLDEALSALGMHIPAAFLEEFAADEIRALIDAVGVYPHTRRTLKELRRRGYRLALLSNCSYTGELVLEALDFPPLFDALVLSHLVGVLKPDPGIYERACQYLDLEPNECAFVGDGAFNELDAAHYLGMLAVRITQDRQSDDYGSSNHADVHIKDIAELLQILPSLAPGEQE